MKSYTDQEQSRRLAKILPIESADMIYLYWINYNTKQEGIDTIPTIREGLPIESCDIPCWSLSALLGVLPDDCSIDKEDGKYVANHLVLNECCAYTRDNPVDACVSVIEYLNKQNLF